VTRVVVVGAGVAGLSVARALLARGARPFVVGLDGGATAAGAGIVSDQFWDPVLRPLARRGARILESLVPVERAGMALIATSDRTAERLAPLRGLRGALPARLRAPFRPEFLRRVVRVAWSSYPFWIRNADVLRALARGLRVRRERVLAVRSDAVRTNRGWIAADAVVVAAGAWTSRLVPAVRGGLEVRRTQTCRAAARLPSMLYVLDSGLYGRPDARGAVVGDGDRRVVGTAPAPGAATEAFATRMRAALGEVLRDVGAVRPWRSGPLLTTPSRRPLAERVDGVWVLAGFGGDGLPLAPAFGEALAVRVLAERAR
jgi:glycine/D-amino acid oxidase-like deaminating enzyme